MILSLSLALSLLDIPPLLSICEEEMVCLPYVYVPT